MATTDAPARPRVRVRVRDTMVPVDEVERDALALAALVLRLTGRPEAADLVGGVALRWDAQQPDPMVLEVGTYRLPGELEPFTDQLA